MIEKNKKVGKIETINKISADINKLSKKLFQGGVNPYRV